MTRCAIIFLSFCLASFGYATVTNEENQISERIYGGRVIDITEAPFMAALYYYDQYICSGSIIDRYYILTAAHCVEGRSGDDLTVKVGSTRHADGTPHAVYDIMIHDGYNTKTAENDVAILFLEDPVELSRSVQVIRLGNRSPKRGESVSVMGWGSVEGKKGASDVLRAAAVTVVGISECRRLHRKVGIVGDNAWCAADPNGKMDTCDGDSGGPAIINGRVVGVTSWGTICGRKDQPGVYTDVPKVRQWIEETLQTYN